MMKRIQVSAVKFPLKNTHGYIEDRIRMSEFIEELNGSKVQDLNGYQFINT